MARTETIALIESTPDDILDRDDPGRVLPRFASGRPLRQMAWHVADTESRYYLPSLGLPSRPRLPALLDELAASARHVHHVVAHVAPDLTRSNSGTTRTTWTTTKMLRRLAWYESAELITMHALATP